TLEVQVNTLAGPRDVVDGAATVTIQPGIAVAGLDITLEVMGQRLTGDFAFAKDSSTGEITVALSQVVLELGDGTQTYVTATITSGVILVTRGGIAGAAVANLTLNPAVLPGVTLIADIIVQVNNTTVDVSRTITVDSTPINITIPKNTLLVQVGLTGNPAEIGILGQTLKGVALFEQRKTATGSKVVRLAFTEVDLFLGDAGADGVDAFGDLTPNYVGLRLTNGRGAFIITPTGMAGEVSGAVALQGLPITITAELTLQLNSLLVGGQGVVVNEVFQFAGVSVTTTTDGTTLTAEVQTLTVGVPSGTFTLALDANKNGTLEANEISAPLAVGASAGAVDTAIEGLIDADAGTDRVTVAAVAGGYTVTWNANGNQPVLQPNVRVLSLPKGPFVRVVATDIQIGIGGSGGITIRADFAFERVGPTAGPQVTRIALANVRLASTESIGGTNPGIVSGSGFLVVFSPGAATSTSPAATTATGGVAGIITGSAQVAAGSFAIGASVGFTLNTTGAIVKQSMTVGAETLTLDLPATPTFQFIVQNLDFSFGDIVEIRAGQFAISSNQFTGSGLELFIGSGPSKLAGGALNPAAIGVLITNAAVAFKKTDNEADGWALRAVGTIALLGLDGLGITGTVSFEVSTSPSHTFPMPQVGSGATLIAAGDVAPGFFSFTALNVVITAGDVVTLRGSLRLTRQPSGALDISLWNATALVTLGGTDIVSLAGFATFSISPQTGFQLGSFRVTNFALFPTALPTPPTSEDLPVIVSGDLASPLRGAVFAGSALTTLTVTFTTTDGTINPLTVTDEQAELEVTVAGAVGTWTVGGTPTAVPGKANTWAYTVTGPALPSTAIVTVKFLAGSVTANYGSGLTSPLVGEEERFYVFTPTDAQPKPGPVASLAVTSVSQTQLNAQGYIDITWTSLPATPGGTPEPINASAINTSTAPFTVSGLLGDLAVDGTGRPTIAGALLISGASPTATSVTFRYFFKDKNPNNTLGLFTGSGNVTITTIAGQISSGAPAASNGVQTLTLAVTAGTVGERTEGGPIALGPLTLQGPTVGLGGFGFSGGKVIVSVILGVQRASLAFGGTPAGDQSLAQTESRITVDLIGLMGSFELAVDVFGLLSGNVDISLTGKWGIQVASLDAQIPNVARIQATGIRFGYDPKGAADQELVRINTATITFPSFGINGSLRPYNPALSSNISANNDQTLAAGVIPGLTVYGNGFKLGTAELAYGLPPTTGTPDPANALTPSAPDKKITIGGILELDDIRIGVSGLEVRFPGYGVSGSAGFTGQIYIATGGAKLFPGKAFGATLTDRLTADDKRPDGTMDDEAFRIALTFSAGKVQAFQLTVDTLEIRLGTFVTLTARDFRLDTGATGSALMASFGSVGAKVTIGSLALAGEGRNFAITGDGSFKALPGFGVFLSIGSATGDGFKWPAFLPVRIDAIGITWDDVERRPGDFVLILSASVTGIQGLQGLQITGAIQGIRIQPSLLAEGKFPIIGIDALGVSVKGKMFGGEVSASLVGGILKLDSTYNIIGVFDTTTPVAQRIFYFGLEGTISIAGLAGFGIRLGLSELGPLQVFLSANVPGGILLEPNSGLTMNDFFGGVEFFTTLPSIEDPFALRSSAFQLPTTLTADQWLAQLQTQVANQAKAISLDPGKGGFAAAFTSPMVITGSAKIFSIYTSQAVLNGQGLVEISTDGKIRGI
ncbi:MAG: hypothetical protein HHJ13_13255, partial [Phycicoccus sp.]|nr:hypothetical protein [Phycicoccus sp.]